MVGIPDEIRTAARGMAKIARMVASSTDGELLAYFAVYACGYAGRGSLEKFSFMKGAIFDSNFIGKIGRSIPDNREETGWILTGWNAQQALIEKNNVRAFILRSQIGNDDLIVNNKLTIPTPAILPGRLPGFIVRYGKEKIYHPISRFYLNLRPRGAIWALQRLAKILDDAGLPYEIKVLAHPRMYKRRDAGVIYLPSSSVQHAIKLLSAEITKVNKVLFSPVPLLTKPLAPGLGFADEPSDLEEPGLSHGQWVSNLFHQASEKSKDPERIARFVVESISEAGRDPYRPYLRSKRM